MMIKDKVAQTFAAAGPVGEFCIVDEYTDESLWHIAIDGTAVFAELDEARKLIVLSADLGRQPADAANSLAELALIYNHGWTHSAGAHLSLDGKDGSFWLLADVAADIKTEPLVGSIHSFARMATAWREIVAGRAEAPMDDFNSLSSGAIRA